MTRRGFMRLHEEESGQMAFAMILTLLVVFMFFALAFDAGAWYFDHRTAQNQADAAALAGALEMRTGGNVETAVDEYLEANGADSGDRDCLETTATTVRVCVRRQSDGLFSALSGIDFAWVSASATATLVEVEVPYSLMAMNQTECSSLNLTGQGTVNVQGTTQAAGTYTRSTCGNALNISGSNSQLIVSGANDIYGGASSRCLNGQCTPLPTDQEYFDDPFAKVPAPSTASCASPNANINVPTGQTRTISPGCYRQISVSGTLRLNPGVYILTRGLSMSGTTGQLIADNVLFYITCPGGVCNGASPQAFDISGAAVVKLSGRSEYENITLFVDRSADPSGGSNVITMSGNGNSTFSGAVYAISGGVALSGQSGTVNLNIAVVADTITFTGQANINITYDIDLIPADYRLALTE